MTILCLSVCLKTRLLEAMVGSLKTQYTFFRNVSQTNCILTTYLLSESTVPSSTKLFASKSRSRVLLLLGLRYLRSANGNVVLAICTVEHGLSLMNNFPRRLNKHAGSYTPCWDSYAETTREWSLSRISPLSTVRQENVQKLVWKPDPSRPARQNPEQTSDIRLAP